ncbi:MAG: hypothetical protein Q9221_000653 [Calogaya cf. arnoldii]
MKTALHVRRLAWLWPHTRFASPFTIIGRPASFASAAKTIEFHALESKWKAKWVAKESEYDKTKNSNAVYRPLAPLRFAMLGTQKPHDGNEKNQVKVSTGEEGYIFDKRLPFATPKESDEFLKLCERDQQLQLCVPDFGLDLVRTAVIFRSQEHLNLNTRGDSRSDNVWLAAQEALLCFTNCLDAADNVKIMKCVATLTTEIIKYDRAYRLDSNVQYHTARILINLIAAFAPSFAEECWVLLHYGSPSLLGIHPNARRRGEVTEEVAKEVHFVHCDFSEAPSLEEIEATLAKGEKEYGSGYTRLPRECYPETLSSLFEIAPPIPEAAEAVYLLKQRLDARKTEKSDNE